MTSPSTLATVAAVSLFALSVPAAYGWGPVAHMTFNCRAYFPDTPLSECLQNNPTFAVSSDLPDAFGFGAFRIGVPGYACTNLTYVHDPVFGGEMVLMAMEEKRKSSNRGNSSSTFDPMAMAVGFTGHIMGDLVGFNAARGALCTREAAACDAAGILYMPEWGYMSSIDAHYYASGGLPAGPTPPLMGNDTLGQDAYDFLSRASVAYSAKNPSFAPFSAEAARQCVDYWRGNMAYVYDRSLYYAGGGAERSAALTAELSWFAPRGTSDISAYLESQASCAAKTVARHHAVLMKTRDPKGAVADAAQFVKGLYDSGDCVQGRSF